MEIFYCPQFLFGYDRGHSLISGSEQLPARMESFLARHSDVAPGIAFERMEQYWSGIPISSTEYALISTWPAPEMPRPGCVWSHVIVLDRSALAGITDLSELRRFFRRPVDASDHMQYREDVCISTFEKQCAERPSREALVQVLRAVYEPETEGVAEYSQADREEATFEIWSQQWPALRNSFSFNTALQTWHGSGTSSQYWLQFKSLHRSSASRRSLPSWIAELYSALESEYPLNDLLQQAGPELPPEPSTVRLLARLFAFEKGKKLDPELKAIKFAARELPSPTDGRLLKEWLIQETLRWGDGRQVLSLVEFLLRDSEAMAFPSLDLSIQGKLAGLWESEPVRLFELLREAKIERNMHSHRVLQLLAEQAPMDVLSRDNGESSWAGKVILAEERPELLLNANISSAPTDVLIGLIDVSIQLESSAAESIFAELLRRPLGPKCQAVLDEREGDFINAIVSSICSVRGSDDVHPDWSERFSTFEVKIISNALDFCCTTKSICDVLAFLSWPQDLEVIGSAEAWLNFFSKAKDDCPTQQRQWLYATVLNVAFLDQGSASIELFELIVPTIHKWLKFDELEYGAQNRILRNVGHYFMVPYWDYCERLKLRIEDAYKARGAEWRFRQQLKEKLK